MSFIDVGDWTPDQVADWLKGLDDCVLPYINFLLNNGVDGCRLLTLTPDTLDNLNVKKIGHQEIMLEGVDLLKQLHYELMSETLQSQSLKVGCKARSLFNQLKQDEDKQRFTGKTTDRVSTTTLAGVSGIMEQVKQLISWIDRYPFSQQPMYLPIRRTILSHSIELVLTAQRDQFVEKPNLIIKNACQSLACLCDRLVTELTDSLAITPASLEVIGMKKKETESHFGIQMNSTYNGVHMIVRVKDPSPAYRCGRIEEGDEIIQIRYQTVVGWTMNKVVKAMNESPQGILITFKKRPRHDALPFPMAQVEAGAKLKEKTASRAMRTASHRGSARSQTQTLGRNFGSQTQTQFAHQRKVQPQKQQVYGSVVPPASADGQALKQPTQRKSPSSSTSKISSHTRERSGSSSAALSGPSTSSRSGRLPPPPLLLVSPPQQPPHNNYDDETDEETSFESNYKQTQLKGPVVREGIRKQIVRRTRVERRNTISGSSPTTLEPPIRIQDLVPNSVKVARQQFPLERPAFDRRLSHDAIPCNLGNMSINEEDDDHHHQMRTKNNSSCSGSSSGIGSNNGSSHGLRCQSPAASSTVSSCSGKIARDSNRNNRDVPPPSSSSAQDSVMRFVPVSCKSSSVTITGATLKSHHKNKSINNNVDNQVPYAKVVPLERKIPKQPSNHNLSSPTPTTPLVSSCASVVKGICHGSTCISYTDATTIPKQVDQSPQQVLESNKSSDESRDVHASNTYEEIPAFLIYGRLRPPPHVGVVIPSHPVISTPTSSNPPPVSPKEESKPSQTSSPGQLIEDHLNQMVKDIPPPLPLRSFSILTPSPPTPPIPRPRGSRIRLGSLGLVVTPSSSRDHIKDAGKLKMVSSRTSSTTNGAASSPMLLLNYISQVKSGKGDNFSE